MNNFKKIGATALAASLGALSAQAVEVSFNGTSKVTYGSRSASDSDAAGTSSAITEGEAFGADVTIDASMSGELDNGFTVSGFMDDISNGMTSAAITLGMGSMGSVRFNQAATGAVDGYDDVLPNAYEETSDQAGHSFAGQAIGGTSEGGSISYLSPTIEFGGASIDVVADFDPNGGGTAGAGTGADNAAGYSSSMALGTKVSFAGLSLYAAQEEVETALIGAQNSAADAVHSMVQATYSAGPISIGYGEWFKNTGNGGGDYSTEGWSVAFAVNDDLSVSYGTLEDTREAISATAAETADATSIQASYTMGSMALKIQHNETDNSYFNANQTTDNTEIALSFSF